MATYRSNTVRLRDQQLAVWSVTVSWTDPTPENSTFYEIEWRIGSGETNFVSPVAEIPYQIWIPPYPFEPGEWVYARVRGVYDDSTVGGRIDGEWSDWQGYQYPIVDARQQAGWRSSIFGYQLSSSRQAGWWSPLYGYQMMSVDPAVEVTKTAFLDALLQRTGMTHQVSLDAVLWAALQRDVSLDALLRAVQSESLSLDALAQASQGQTVSLDALAAAVRSETLSLDALAQASQDQAVSLDVILSGGTAHDVLLDALLQSDASLSVGLDVILSSETEEWRYTEIVVLEDEPLYSSASSTTQVDALLQKTQSQSLSLDVLLQAPPSSSVLLDAILFSEGEETRYTNVVVLSEQLLEPPSGKDWVVIAGLPWNENHRSVLEDADPPAVNGDVIEHDLATSPGEFSITMYPDGTFAFGEDDDYSPQTFEYSLWRAAAATWYGPETVEVITPAATTVSLDTLLQRTGITQATSLDALLWAALQRDVSLDALLRAVQSEALSLDALAQASQGQTVSVDALAQAVRSETLSLDAFLSILATQTTALDALAAEGHP